MLERDARLARVYFDLNSVSVIEDEVRGVLREIKDGWRRVAAALLRDAGLSPARAETAAVMLIVGAEGLSLEWIERGGPPNRGAPSASSSTPRPGRWAIRASRPPSTGE